LALSGSNFPQLRAGHALVKGENRSIVGGVICSAGAFALNESGSALQGIDRNDLCVTNGNISVLSGGWLAIDTPSSRAVVRAGAKYTADQVAEIHFRYLGPTQTSKPLASGELRRQIGLKLQAEDTCNLIYAMWHIEPDTMVAVSPPIRPGQTHTLRAELHGNNLMVTADGNVAWYGGLGNEPPTVPQMHRRDVARPVPSIASYPKATDLRRRNTRREREKRGIWAQPLAILRARVMTRLQGANGVLREHGLQPRWRARRRSEQPRPRT
jgi:hypothetical protein